MPQPFDFPPRVWDPALVFLGGAERLGRVLVRSVLARRMPAAGPREGRRNTCAPAAPPAAGGPRGSVLYLPALPWRYRYQRPQQLAAAIADLGHPTLYVEVFDRAWVQPRRRLFRPGPRIHVLRLAVPGRPDPFRAVPSPASASALARMIVAGLSTRPDFILAQLPFWASVAGELRSHLGCPLIYDRIDLHRGFHGVAEVTSEAEEELIELADLVTTTSRDLAERTRPHGRRVRLLPNAVSLEDFPFKDQPRTEPRGPLRVGYVGALHHWFDVEAVRMAASSSPEWRFILAGRVEDEGVAQLGRLANVSLVGEIPYRAVAEFLAGIEVLMIPFRDLPLTRAVDPVKVYEALAVGIPVVARRLPELRKWEEPLCFTYERPDELMPLIRRAHATDAAELHRRRRQQVETETWSLRAQELLGSVAALCSELPRQSRG